MSLRTNCFKLIKLYFIIDDNKMNNRSKPYCGKLCPGFYCAKNKCKQLSPQSHKVSAGECNMQVGCTLEKISLRHSGKKEDLGSAGLWRQNSPRAASLNAEGPEKLRESASGFTMNMKPECVKNSLSLQFYLLPTSSLLMNANF